MDIMERSQSFPIVRLVFVSLLSNSMLSSLLLMITEFLMYYREVACTVL